MNYLGMKSFFLPYKWHTHEWKWNYLCLGSHLVWSYVSLGCNTFIAIVKRTLLCQQIVQHIIPKPRRSLSCILSLSKHLIKPMGCFRVKTFMNFSFMLWSPLNLPLWQSIKYESSIIVKLHFTLNIHNKEHKISLMMCYLETLPERFFLFWRYGSLCRPSL